MSHRTSCSTTLDEHPAIQTPADQPAGRGDTLHRLFDVAVVLKGLAGAAELLLGFLLLMLAPAQLAAPLLWLADSELGEFHPVGRLAATGAAAAAELAPATVTFVAVYLVVHGIIKAVLVVAVLRHQVWAYPWMIVALAAFIAYQTYELTIHPTVGLVALTVFDITVVVLTVREFRMQRVLLTP